MCDGGGVREGRRSSAHRDLRLRGVDVKAAHTRLMLHYRGGERIVDKDLAHLSRQDGEGGRRGGGEIVGEEGVRRVEKAVPGRL